VKQDVDIPDSCGSGAYTRDDIFDPLNLADLQFAGVVIDFALQSRDASLRRRCLQQKEKQSRN
jgi:hypothetical protein